MKFTFKFLEPHFAIQNQDIFEVSDGTTTAICCISSDSGDIREVFASKVDGDSMVKALKGRKLPLSSLALNEFEYNFD